MQRFLSLVSTLALLSLFGCSDSCPSSSNSPAASEVIDASGGTVQVTQGVLTGVTLVVPPNSISQRTTISVFEGVVSTVPGELAVGPAAEFTPEPTGFNPPALLVLTFDPALVPSGVAPADYIVKSRASTGEITDLTPKQVDTANGLLSVDIFALATFWVAVPDVFVADDYLPLQSGNVYRFNNGFVLTVSETTNEPNFESVRMFKLSWSGVGLTTGVYLDPDAQGAINALGNFWVSTGLINEQQRFSAPWLFLAAREEVGTERDSVRNYNVFSPFGGLVPARMGIADINTAFPSRGPVATPLGTFTDTVRVELTTNWAETPPGPKGAFGTSLVTLCLAKDVGPVAYQIDMMPAGLITSGTVNGTDIVAQ